MSTHNNDEHLLIYNYLRKYLDKMIIKHNQMEDIIEHNQMEDDVLPKVIRDIKEESIIDILDYLEGK